MSTGAIAHTGGADTDDGAYGPTSKGWAGLMLMYVIIAMFGFGFLVHGLRKMAGDLMEGIAYTLMGIVLLVMFLSGVHLYRKQTKVDRTKKISISNWRAIALVMWLGVANMMSTIRPHVSSTN